MHHYWAVPGEAEISHRFYDDDLTQYEINRLEGDGDEALKISSRNLENAGLNFGYYHNAHEGRSEQFLRRGAGIEVKGPLSVATTDPQGTFIPHSKFVEHAIRNGKGHEVPNSTMAEYVAGRLDTRMVTSAERARIERHPNGIITPRLDVSSPEWDAQPGEMLSGPYGIQPLRETEGKLREISKGQSGRYRPEDTELGQEPQRIDLQKIEGLVHTGYAERVKTAYRGIFH
jgi:hypothetical protein